MLNLRSHVTRNRVDARVKPGHDDLGGWVVVIAD
jgi:hypothetical protein